MRNDAFGRAITAARSNDLGWFEEYFDRCELYDVCLEITNFAVRYGSLDVLKYILYESVYGINIEANNNLLITSAAEYGHLTIVEELIKADIDLDIATENLVPAITGAAKNGYAEIIVLLINQYPISDELQIHIDLILTEILKTDNTATLECLALIIQHVHQNAMSIDYRIFLHTSAQYGSVTALYQLLSLSSWQIVLPHDEIMSLYITAIEHDQLKFCASIYNGKLHELLDYDITTKSLDWNILLNVAAKSGALQCLNWIIDNFKAEILNNDGFALRHAAKNGHFEIVNALLAALCSKTEKKCSVNEVMQFAIIRNNVELVKHLINHDEYIVDLLTISKAIKGFGFLKDGQAALRYFQNYTKDR